MSGAAPEHGVEHENRHAATHEERRLAVTVTINADDHEKFLACWQDWRTNGKFEQRQALRRADVTQGAESLAWLIDTVMRRNFTCGSSYTIAGVLGSLYNGERVKANLYRINGLDHEAVEHLIHVIRLHTVAPQEIHNYIINGGQIFEQMIKAYRLEKRRRHS